MRVLLVFFLSAASFFAKASEPITKAEGNGHLSAIYHSEKFVLQLANGQKLTAEKNGAKIRLGSKPYDCKVTHFGHYWGTSQTGLDCGGRLRSDNVYIRILAEAKKNKINGFLLIGPDEGIVQVEINWLRGNRRRLNDPSVSMIGFDLIKHEGWITN